MQYQDMPFPLRLYTHEQTPTIKLYRDNTHDLNLFRHKLTIDKGGPLLYSSAKKKVISYKLIFAGLAAFFIFLAVCLWAHSIPFATGALTVAASTLLKNVMGALCAFIGGTALFLATKMRTECDVAARLKRRARRHLDRRYARKKVEKGLTRFLNYGVNYSASVTLKTAYLEAVGLIHDHYTETLQLLEHIAHCAGMAQESREHLYNQTLTELKQKLHRAVKEF